MNAAPGEAMTPVTFVSGCPGTGKTTLATGLAAAAEGGVHLRADDFFAFLAHPIAPVLRESHAQNTAVTRALARAAAGFAEAGYEVYVDGVLGPWFLPVVARELIEAVEGADYVVLRAALDETTERGTTRAAPVGTPVIEQMHRAFADLGPFEAHVIETTRRSAEETLAEFQRRRAEGALALDLPGLAAAADGG